MAMEELVLWEVDGVQHSSVTRSYVYLDILLFELITDIY